MNILGISPAEKVLFEYFNVPMILAERDPIGCYRLAVERAFLTNDQTSYAEALRRGYEAVAHVKMYRMTSEFENLIEIKKQSNIMTDTTSATPEQKTIAPPFSNPKYRDGPEKLRRNEYGLFENIDYKYDENGFVDWKAMINPKFLYPNKGWFERAGKPIPESIEDLQDHQLLCKLGGYKELARLRGFSNVEYELQHLENSVSCTCIITWIPNYETTYEDTVGFAREVKFSSIANSTSENCGDFMAAFKETQAENRAFVRCVRNFLNVNIVGDDEISKGKVVEESSKENSPDALNPQKNLEFHASKKGLKTFPALKDFLISKEFKKKDAKAPWSKFEDIPPNECWRIITLLND